MMKYYRREKWPDLSLEYKTRKMFHIGLEVLVLLKSTRQSFYLFIYYFRSKFSKTKKLKPIRENTVHIVPVRIGKRVEIK